MGAKFRKSGRGAGRKDRALAATTDDERLRFEALRYLIDRRAGKPFVAVNPAERKPSQTDRRIQMAVQTLILGQQPISAEEPESAAPEPQLHGDLR